MAKMALRVSGQWISGEIWNFGMHADTTRTAADTAAALAAAVTEAWSGAGTPTGALNSLYGPDVVVTEASAAEILLIGGKQQTKATVALNLPGVSAAAQLPPQVAVVVSKRTNIANRAGRGRFYLPAMTVNAVDGGRLSIASRDLVLNAVERMITSLKGAQVFPMLWPVGAMNGTPIVAWGVGDVFDTQRRRRNALVEARSFRTF